MARILIVDDHAPSLELVRTILQNGGHDVMEARDGAEALPAALRWVPDLVLLDLQMPVMDGFATLEAFRKHPELNHIPIVALTARAMRGYDEVVIAAGFSGYITKPLSLKDFRRQVHGFLRWPDIVCDLDGQDA
jgi:two-component system cell cycle response regulator DivK